MSLAKYTYASHALRGFSPNAAGAASISVTVEGEQPIAKDMAMLTAADVVGIPAAQVIRSWPRDGSRDVAPNYLALVEFDGPEVPWQFSRPPGPDGRVQPWITLVVIELGKGKPSPLDLGTSPPRLTIDADELPAVGDAWMWAHVQFLGAEQVPADPVRSLSRLVAARRLGPDAHWLACVVPTLESARLSGLGAAEQAAALRASDKPAWSAGGGEVELPVYHFFEFATGASGDFEKLVRALHGVELPPGMGTRQLRLDHPASGVTLPEPAGSEVEMHVALRRVGTVAPSIDPVGQDYLQVLASRLTDAGYDISLLHDPAAGPPRVGPPVYGQLAVGANGAAAKLSTPAAPPWLTELNLDPRMRVAAGLGAQVVRDRQDHYVEEAWRQVGDVLAANRLRRRAEYSLGTSRSLYSRWLTQLDDGDLLTSAAPVLPRISVAAAETVRGTLERTVVSPSAVSVELRRQTRARGAFARPAWRGAVSVNVLAAASPTASPFTRRLDMDGMHVLAPPSEVWRPEIMQEILVALVPELAGAQLSEAVVAEKLDKASRVVTVSVPTVAEVDAAAARTTIDVDRVASAIGLLPISAVTSMLAQPVAPVDVAPVDVAPVEPPVDQPRRPRGRRRGPVIIGRHDEGEDQGVVLQPVEGIDRQAIHIPLDRVGVAAPIDHVELAAPAEHIAFGAAADHADAALLLQHLDVGARPVLLERADDGAMVWRRRGQAGDLDIGAVTGIAEAQVVMASRMGQITAASDALRYIKADPALVSVTDGRVALDTAAISRQALVGAAAMTIDAATFESVVDGSFHAPALEVSGFGLTVGATDAARAALIDAVRLEADHVIRPDLVGEAGPPALAGGLAGLRSTVLTALDPRLTLKVAINHRLGALLGGERDVFDDIMRAPDLSEPTYDGLAAISNDWVLPGIDRMEPNTTTLVASNRSFISAFLVGMNHELARELLWHEYPTDQRGTFARQFWSHPITADPESRFDLHHELHRGAGQSLNSLGIGAGATADDPLVLVVKGDLVRRYPSVIIQAGHTKPDGDHRTMAGAGIDPDFRGLLAPDVLLVGFSGLTEPMVRAVQNDPNAAYWFFFSEHVAEPRFGLDEPPDPANGQPPALTTWNDATWAAAALERDRFLGRTSFSASIAKGVGAGAPKFEWGRNAASQAWIMLQFPFRRGMPATKLLPEKKP